MFDTLIVGPLKQMLELFYTISSSIGFPNYGVAIILMTVVIKAFLAPLTYKSVKSMKAMQDMQPKMKELQTKYKSDPQKMNMELAKLYKEAGVNPLAGCLPMIIQMPFLIGVFYAISQFEYVQEPSFLWLQNLANSDPYYILPVLSALTTFVQSRQTTTPDNQQAKMMLYIMPLFIGYISINFSAGLVLYWVVSNIFQIIQQWFMYRKTAHV